MSQDAINFALQIIGNDQTAKSQKISKELAKINWQYQVVKSIDYIQNQEYAIALSKLSLENEKKKLDVLEKQYELGLKTLDDLDKSKQSYEKSQKDLIKAQENLEEEYVALNRQMGVPLDTKYNIVYDNSYEKMKKVDISSYTTTALLENLNIQLSKMSLESAQNNLDFYMTSNEKIETLRLRVSQASRSLADAKNSLQDKIRKTYTKVEQQETTYANAVKDLETAKNNYDIAQVKFNVGVISQMELEEYKLAIAKAEVAVESAIRSYNEFKMQFMDTNLL
jgi:outer membrane protein TolC